MRDCKKSGFTLLEVLISLGLGGLILVATVQFVFSLQQIWTETQSQNAFDQHLDSSSFFMQFVLNNASSISENDNSKERDASSKSGDNSSRIQAISPEWSKGFNRGYLHFRLDSPPSIFSDQSRAINTPILIFWDVEDTDSGIQFFWYKEGEIIENEDDLYRTQISAFIDDIKLHYYDKDFQNWKEEEELLEENKQYILPDFIELKYKNKEEEYQRFLVLDKTHTES